MRLSGQNVLHSGAVQWYYEVAAGHGPGVPEAIIRHIRQCWACRKQIHRLKEAVTGAGGETDGSRSEMKRDVIDTLSLHFGCLDEQVTCSRVRPFLPGLLMPSVQIRIPTPITVHIDHCPECAEDLEALRDLSLGAEQLERLEQLYQHETVIASEARQSRENPRLRLGILPLRRGESRLCRRARARIADFVRGSLDEIDREVLNHLSVCPRCRGQVFRSRQKLLEEWPTGETGAAVCGDAISMAQLFDYAVPYGRTAGSRERAGASHVHACQACLTRIQRLDETIYGIAERTNSGVATIYSALERDAQPARRTDSQADDAEESAGPFAESYPDHPIRVQVRHGEPEQAAARALRLGSGRAWSRAKVKAALQRTTCNPQVRFLLKTAAVAALIPLMFLLFPTTPTTGITLAEVVKAFGKAENVHVSKFYADTDRVTQELWISRTADAVLSVEGQNRVLYDLGERKAHAYPAPGASERVMELNEGAYASTRRMIDDCLGLLAGDISPHARWTRADDHGAEGIEVYELTYESRSSPSTVLSWKWKVRIDSLTRRPREVQTLRRAPSEKEWRCLRRIEVQYLTGDEMTAVLGKERVHDKE
ncbi:MAG: zf-HC2 domain-containing protein [Phycisphaerae bacterium]|nr:zf-HC2 domain-containing protein [Phycisphaerae bacterium]